MITADQIVCHAVGDYILQSDWMANEKTKQHTAAFCHALLYSVGFLLFRPTTVAWITILVTHFFIDRYRLARYIVWIKNFIAPRGSNTSWVDCSGTGYSSSRPAWLAVWLLIFVDNILHILINGIALEYL